jgi:hypothetical protein
MQQGRRRPCVQDRSDQDGVEGERQREVGKPRRRQTGTLGRLIPLRPRGVHRRKIHGERRDRERRQHHLRANLDGQQVECEHFCPEQSGRRQTDVDSQPPHDEIGIEVGVNPRKHQAEREQLAPSLCDHRRRQHVQVPEGFLEEWVEPLARDLSAEQKQQPARERRMAGVEERQSELAATKRAVIRREGSFDVDADQAENHQECARRRDLGELAQVGEQQQAGHGHAAHKHRHEHPVLQHARRRGVEATGDHSRHPHMAVERDQVLGVIEPQVQRHNQTREQRERPAGELVAGATD